MDESTNISSNPSEDLREYESNEYEYEKDILQSSLSGLSNHDYEDMIPSMFLSEEESLENLLRNSSAFLQDEDLVAFSEIADLRDKGFTKIESVEKKKKLTRTTIDHNGIFENDGFDDEEDDYDDGDNEEDEMKEDLSRLAAAEEDIRMELEMLLNNGFNEFSLDSQNKNEINGGVIDENVNNEAPTQISSSAAHKNKRKKRKKKLERVLFPEEDHQDILHDKHEYQIKPSSSEPGNNEINWEKQVEDLGVQRMIREESKGKPHLHMPIYKCPLPNPIYDRIIDNEIENTIHSSPNSVIPEMETNLDLPKLSPQQMDVLFLCNSEYILPMSSHLLRKIFAGLSSPGTTTSAQSKHSEKSTALLKDLNMSDLQQDDPIEQQQSNHSSSASCQSEEDFAEQMPIRTCTLRIRPDVLCGAVMDALSHIVLMERDGEIIKRQGGHLIAALPGFWFRKKKKKPLYHLNDSLDAWDDGDTMTNNNAGDEVSAAGKKKKKEKKKKRKVFLPPLCMDAQLVTKKRGGIKGDSCERVLLIRFYEIKESDNSSMSILDPMDDKDCEYGKENTEEVKEKYSDEYDLLADAAYVLHQMKKEELAENASKQSGPFSTIHSKDPGKGTCDSGIQSKHTRDYVSKVGKLLSSPIRILSHVHVTKRSYETESKDQQLQQHLSSIFSSSQSNLQQSAFRFLTICISELETRELSYSTLLAPSSKFCAFPALSTLDVQYCSQLRIACRESMILNLLKTSSGLEQYAREMEMKCVAFVRLLVEGVIKDYGLDLPKVPKIIPLSAFPLNFKAAEVKCPPWGQKVADALQSISISCSKANNTQEIGAISENSGCDSTSEEINNSDESKNEKDGTADFDNASRAVQQVVYAFSSQDDEEIAARIGRKNLQVMDRMIKMQAFTRRSIMSISDSYGSNPMAAKAADHFHSMAIEANVLKLIEEDSVHDQTDLSSEQFETSHKYEASDQVPILKCGVVVEGSPGTCYVTRNQILFAVNIGFLSGSAYSLVSISDIELVPFENTSKSLFHSSSKVGLSLRMYPNKKNKDVRVRGKNSIHSHYNEDIDQIIENTNEVFSFTSSLGADQFKKFVDTVKIIKEENIKE